MKRNTGIEPVTYRLIEFAVCIPKLASLAGFEPTTPWFVAKYSIQLSYRRINFWRKARESNSTPLLEQSDFESVTGPACLTFHCLVSPRGFEPRPPDPKSGTLPGYAIER